MLRAVLLCLALTACGGVADGSVLLRVAGAIKVRLAPDGAIVIDKQRVASLADDGRVIDVHGRTWAWLYPDAIRVAGGAQIPIKTADDGSVYLPVEATEKAGLKPVRTRVSAKGEVVTETGGRTRLQIEGGSDERFRRSGLLLLLLFANPPR